MRTELTLYNVDLFFGYHLHHILSHLMTSRMILRVIYVILLLWLCTPSSTAEKIARSDFDSLTNAKARAVELLNLIFARYELHNTLNMQHFLVSMNIPLITWDILRLKVIEKILHKGSAFTFVFSGTGVTAGYDNYFHQSYPMVIERRLSPIFKALSIELVVRNIGQVHMDCRLSNYCFDAMGGEVADVVGWENSFDCGNAKDAHEYIARVAAWKKAVVFYSTSGAYSIDDCPPSKDAVPWISESWTPESVGIKPIIFDRSRVREFQAMHQDWHQAGSTAARFTKALKNKYSGVGAHGFSVWAKTTKVCDYNNTGTGASGSRSRRSLTVASNTAPNFLKRKQRDGATATERTDSDHHSHDQQLIQKSKNSKEKPRKESYCESVRLKGACQAAGGPHWRVQEAGHYGNSQQRGRKWHPPIGMHLLRAEMLVYTYAHIVLDAVYWVEEALQQRGVDLKRNTVSKAKKGGRSVASVKHELLKEVRAQLASLQTPAPTEPLHCASEECSVLPQCYTDYLPNYNQAHLLSNIIVGTHLGWYKEGVAMNDLGPEFGLLDKKYYYKSEGGKNELHLQLTNVRSGGSVRVYARAKKEPLDEAAFYLDPNMNVLQNTPVYKSREAYVPTAARYQLKAVQVSNTSSSVEYVHLSGIPAGDHVLTVMTAPHNPFVISSLSHIVVF